MEKQDKVDVVILWVDGSDPEWLKKRNYWAELNGLEIIGEERYRDWENLKYLFRGIEENMPWVNHVYLVTDNQVPLWLDTNYNKVTVVDHKEIISQEKLPLFNSNAIELNVHKIKGLSEKFIYFNDDIFVIKNTKMSDFFQDGVPLETSFLLPTFPSFGSWEKYIYNDVSIINEHHNVLKTVLRKPSNWFSFKIGKYILNNILLLRWTKFSSLYFTHIATSFTKATFDEVWDLYYEKLDKVSSNKFRTNDDNSIGVVKFWQIAANNFKQRSIKFGKAISIIDDESLSSCIEIIERQKYHIVCINDNEKLTNFETVKNEVNNRLEKILPRKSKFEL